MSNAPDDDAKEAVFLKAIEALPDSTDMLKSYALFLEQVRKDPDKAEEYYKRAIATNPMHSTEFSVLCRFLGKFQARCRQG